MSYVLTDSTAEFVRQLTRNRNIWDEAGESKATVLSNNQQWISITGDSIAITVGGITKKLYPAKIVRLDVTALTWIDYANVYALAANDETLSVGQTLLGYCFGSVEVSDVSLQVFVVSCCSDKKWYCLEAYVPPIYTTGETNCISDVNLSLGTGYTTTINPGEELYWVYPSSFFGYGEPFTATFTGITGGATFIVGHGYCLILSINMTKFVDGTYVFHASSNPPTTGVIRLWIRSGTITSPRVVTWTITHP